MFADSRKRVFGRRRPSADVNFQRSIYHRRLRCEPLEQRRVLSTGPLHVDADSLALDPDGLDWETAYPALQDALDRADVLNNDIDPDNDVEAIWIAEGTYKPTSQLDPVDARSATFSMLDSISLYGQFAGDEPDLDSRHGGDTILSGDLDLSGDLSDGDAYHIVYADEVTDVTLDALTITGGNASTYPNHYGGGIYGRGTLTITNSIISGNQARYDGGGIYSRGTLTITNSTISGNQAGGIGGGGIYSDGTLTVTNSNHLGEFGQRARRRDLQQLRRHTDRYQLVHLREFGQLARRRDSQCWHPDRHQLDHLG